MVDEVRIFGVAVRRNSFVAGAIRRHCTRPVIGIVGIEDPLREGVRKAVKDCQKTGVVVKICTGDNMLTARSIATKCGIVMAGGIILEGPVFRLLEALGLFDYIVVLYS